MCGGSWTFFGSHVFLSATILPTLGNYLTIKFTRMLVLSCTTTKSKIDKSQLRWCIWNHLPGLKNTFEVKWRAGLPDLTVTVLVIRHFFFITIQFLFTKNMDLKSCSSEIMLKITILVPKSPLKKVFKKCFK